MRLAKLVDVAVVGGGIAGLMAAYILEKRGLSVVVLESDTRFGGRVRTLHYGRTSAEAGAQELWNGTEPMNIACKFGLPLESEPAISSIFAKGRLLAIDRNRPEAYLEDIFTERDFRSFHKCKSNIATFLRRASDPELTLRNTSFLECLHGFDVAPNVLEWIKMTLEPELGAPLEAVSALSGIHVASVLLQPGQFAVRIVGGNSRLVDAFWSRRRGTRVRDATVTGINLGSDELITVTFLHKDHRDAIRARRVLVTVPWNRLGEIQFAPCLPDEILGKVLTLGRGGYVVIHVECDGRCTAIPAALRDSFPILTGNYLGVLYCPQRVSKRLIVSILQYGEPALAFQHNPVNELRQIVIERLEFIFPGISKDIKGVTLFPYHPAAVPFWPPGRSSMDEWSLRMLEPFGGVYFAGDYFFGGQLQGAVQSASVQCQAIISDLSPQKIRRRSRPQRRQRGW